MSSCAGQDEVDTEKEVQNTTTDRSPVAAVDDNGNIDDTPTVMTEYVTGGRLVAVTVALVLSIFLVWLPHLVHCVFSLTRIPSRPRWIWYGHKLLSTLPHFDVEGIDQSCIRQTIIATAIPHITDEFHSLNQVGWYASALFITVAATQSAWGKAFKYFSIKIVYLLSILVFELGSLLCGKVVPRPPFV